ncbi:MAG: hypothetical protein AAGD92_09205 [Pseudomonadota bacterium]
MAEWTRNGARAVLIAATAAGAAACASGEKLSVLRETPSFQVGYNDGCLTSNEEDKSFSTKKARDANAFEADEAYRAGWRQGYLECGGQRTRDATDGGRILGERNEY